MKKPFKVEAGQTYHFEVTFEQPRSWWRRLLHLPARRTKRGPYNAKPWTEIFETAHGPVAQAGFAMDTKQVTMTQGTFTPLTTKDRPASRS